MKPANAAPLSTDKKFTFSEVADAFFVAYNGRDASLQARIGYWSRELGELPLVDLDEDTVDLHLHRLLKGNALSYRGGASAGGPLQPLQRQRSPATINRYRAALASLIKFARSERLIPKRWESPLKFCDKFAEPQGRLRYLSKSEFESLCKAARVSRYEKLWLYINLALTTGARKGTIESLRWHDIDLENCRATVDRTKNGTPFTLTLTNTIVQEMRRFYKPSCTSELVFRSKHSPDKPYSVTNAYKTALRLAKIENACIHTLRHSHASWLGQKGASLMQIAESMNHKSLAMVKRYAHLCVEDRARMIDNIFGDQS